MDSFLAVGALHRQSCLLQHVGLGVDRLAGPIFSSSRNEFFSSEKFEQAEEAVVGWLVI
jgi:hypothetical protein